MHHLDLEIQHRTASLKEERKEMTELEMACHSVRIPRPCHSGTCSLVHHCVFIIDAQELITKWKQKKQRDREAKRRKGKGGG